MSNFLQDLRFFSFKLSRNGWEEDKKEKEEDDEENEVEKLETVAVVGVMWL